MDKYPHIDSISFLSDSSGRTLAIKLLNCFANLLTKYTQRFTAVTLYCRPGTTNRLHVYSSIRGLQGYSKGIVQTKSLFSDMCHIRNSEPHCVIHPECHEAESHTVSLTLL